MRILIVSEVFWPEDFIVNDLAREWIRMGHDVDVVTQYPSYPQSYVYEGYKNKGYMTEDWEGVKIHRFPFVEGYRDSKVRKLRNYYSFVRGGRKVVAAIEGRFDCVFVSQTGPLTVTYPALYAKKLFGIPLNIWTCDIWPDAVWGYGIPKSALTAYLLDKMIRKIYHGCDRIFVSSKKFTDTIEKYSGQTCVYAPNWLRPVQPVTSPIVLPDDKINFTFTGNISRYQNLSNTIEGFVKADLDNAQLNIVGDGSYLAEVKAVAERFRASNVVFHGRRPYNEMYDILKRSQILVLPLMPQDGIQKTEPFKLQSYLQAGKPVFGILNGAGRDIIEENGLGVCASPVDTDAIAKGFREMLEFARMHAGDVAVSAEELMKTRFNKAEIVRRIMDNLVTARS